MKADKGFTQRLTLLLSALLVLCILSACSVETEDEYALTIESGLEAIENEEYAKAKDFFESATEQWPDKDEAHLLLDQSKTFNKAFVLHKIGDFTEAREEAELVAKFKGGSELLKDKAWDLMVSIENTYQEANYYQELYNEAKDLLEQNNIEEAHNRVSHLLSHKELNHPFFTSLKEATASLQTSIEHSLGVSAMTVSVMDEELSGSVEEASSILNVSQSDRLIIPPITMSINEYRKQAWFGKNEDPHYSYDMALSILSEVMGPETEAFAYKGERHVYIDEHARRYYVIWRESQVNTFETTNESDNNRTGYLVFDDFTVETHE